jgi:DNA segregation ATPase FtsK/SpoIIIE, S-DNA-T family
MSVSSIETISQRGGASLSSQRARRRFIIAQREPWYLPDDSIELPGPDPITEQKPSFNFSSFAPPIMILLVVYIYSQMNPEMNIGFLIMMPLMSMALPVGNLVSFFFQKKSFKKKLEEREKKYREKLGEIRKELNVLVQQQRVILERGYPDLPNLIKISTGRSSRRRLWWRRSADPDFLSLRMGIGMGEPSISVMPPKSNAPNEPLMPIVVEMAGEFTKVPNLPSLIDLKEVGSLAIASKSGPVGHGTARRLILDLLVHHSPQDVELLVLADRDDARKRWEWVKWAPHTRAILQEESKRLVAFDPISLDKALEWLVSEFNARSETETRRKKNRTPQKAIVVVLDDSGSIRQSGDIRELAELGHEVGIYLIFTGDSRWPRECRARIDVSGKEYSYVETWVGEKNKAREKGDVELASRVDCERVVRALASLEVASGKGDSNLPGSVRLYDLLDMPTLSPEILKQNWQRVRSNDELLQLPFGLQSGRKGLEEIELNLLPDDLGGIGAYHTILVGTTGSGKSEFMKSLVLSTAFKYSPADLNFFFMDFKGGAAFNVLKDLPHVVGVVTNLSPELVERGLSAMEAEIDRRQKWFANAGVQNIWDYNAQYPDKRMPQLLLLLDEFAKGLEEFQRLPGMLDTLVRQGRSLGMYLLLANQDVNSAVDRLLNNVGWRIALKVQRQEDMQIVDRALTIPKRPGQGYLLGNSDPVEFQAAYAGLPIIDLDDQVQEAFKIFKVGLDGRWQLAHSSARKASESGQVKKERGQNEQDHLISIMKIVEKDVQPARPIYLDPLEDNISLEYVFEESVIQKTFDDTWKVKDKENGSLTIPVGFLDSPEECLQEEMEIDFKDQDGHLWIVGSPGSGKAMTVETILLSLALTHTPEEANFYILEYGAGQLLKFNKFPHTGAVIRSTDSEELLDKLLNYLDDEMDRRTDLRGQGQKSNYNKPALFLIINNFAEMRTNYPDHADRISRYASDGKAVGLHLIITTNRRIELGRLSIARRIVLQLSNRDDYMDAVGKSVIRPSVQAEGRGLWVVDRKVAECQIAQPEVAIGDSEILQDVTSVCQRMRKTWSGSEAHQVRVLPDLIPLSELLKRQGTQKQDMLPIPVGVSFESVQLVSPGLFKEMPRWLVLGPPRSGKSNFLASVAKTVLAHSKKDWVIYYFAFRRSPLEWADKKIVKIAKTQDEIQQAFEQISELIQKLKGKKLLLLFDDLGGAFEPGSETLVAGLNKLSQDIGSQENIYLMAAGMSDELSMHRMTSLLVRSLRQSRTGISFSKDPNDLDWFGSTVPLQYRRMVLPPGRGFWVSGGKATLVQSPWAGSDEPE